MTMNTLTKLIIMVLCSTCRHAACSHTRACSHTSRSFKPYNTFHALHVLHCLQHVT